MFQRLYFEWLFQIGLGSRTRGLQRLTIDSNSDALAQNEPIFALESWNFPKGVDIEVLSTHTLGWLLVNDLNLEAICLCNSQEDSRARVLLQKIRNMLIKQ